MTTALQTLQAALEREGLDAYLNGNVVETFRNWSYESGADTATDWYNPADEYVEAYSDTLYITFTGSSFIAKDEQGREVAREEVIAEYDPAAGITVTDIEYAADAMAATIAEILPARDIAGEIAEAKAENMLFRLEDAA